MRIVSLILSFSVPLVISAAFLSTDSAAARILLGWPDTDDKRGIDFRVFALHIFHNHAVDTDDDFR